MLQTRPPVVGRVVAADRPADGNQDCSSHEPRQVISHQRGGGSRCHQQCGRPDYANRLSGRPIRWSARGMVAAQTRRTRAAAQKA
jgi:hypothetical protein